MKLRLLVVSPAQVVGVPIFNGAQPPLPHLQHLCFLLLLMTSLVTYNGSYRCILHLPTNANIEAFARVLLQTDCKTPSYLFLFRDTEKGRKYFVAWENLPLSRASWVYQSNVEKYLSSFPPPLNATCVEEELLEVLARTCSTPDRFIRHVEGLVEKISSTREQKRRRTTVSSVQAPGTTQDLVMSGVTTPTTVSVSTSGISTPLLIHSEVNEHQIPWASTDVTDASVLDTTYAGEIDLSLKDRTISYLMKSLSAPATYRYCSTDTSPRSFWLSVWVLVKTFRLRPMLGHTKSDHARDFKRTVLEYVSTFLN
jgi:hypothetical protein